MMKSPIIWNILDSLLVVILASNAGGVNFCSWSTNSFECQKSEFRCETGKCIGRSLYCDGTNNCGDNSDEKYCSVPDFQECPKSYFSCQTDNSWGNSRKCIPEKWRCDGYNNCPNGNDEGRDCRNRHTTNIVTRSESATAKGQNSIAMSEVKRWLNDQRNELNSAEKWGSSVDKLASIFHLTNISMTGPFSPNTADEAEMVYELNIQMLSLLSSMKLENIPSTELASYLNAFLGMCINPRNFHGHDIVQELRNRVDKENYTNPYVSLALCNAGETITEVDKNKLIETFENKHRTFWTGMQAVVVMALACANKQSGNDVDSETLREMTLELKQQQYRNGTVVDLPTTALVMQALISTHSESDPDNFDEMKAFQELLRNQKPDGSFGDVMNTFLVTPVLICKSLADINSSHCHYGSRDETSALEDLSRRSGPKIRIQYSLWIGNEKDLERNLILRVPQNMSLYGVMELAAEIDYRFKLEYSVKNRKPYVSAISGMRDNPLTGKFWFLNIIQDGKPSFLNESPADIIPKDNDHYVMWYRRGTWIG